MSLVSFLNELEIVYQNREKIADPENKTFIENLFGRVYSNETFSLTEETTMKVSFLYDEVLK